MTYPITWYQIRHNEAGFYWNLFERYSTGATFCSCGWRCEWEGREDIVRAFEAKGLVCFDEKADLWHAPDQPIPEFPATYSPSLVPAPSLG
jgi:hypothetical protein